MTKIIMLMETKWQNETRGEEVETKYGNGGTAGKIPLGRSRLRWECNIRMDLTEIAISMRNWLILLRIGFIEELL